MENRNVKLKEYWKIGVMEKWVGETASASCAMLIILLCPVIARICSDEATALMILEKTRLLHSFAMTRRPIFNNLPMVPDQ